jgi:very-short-patch-repair endonuclease
MKDQSQICKKGFQKGHPFYGELSKPNYFKKGMIPWNFKGLINKKCLYCNNIFSVSKSETTKRKRKFCSCSCSNKYNRKKVSLALTGRKLSQDRIIKMSERMRGRFAGDKHPNWKGGWKNKLPKCLDCGKRLSNSINKRCKKCNYKSKEFIDFLALQNSKQQNHKEFTSIEKKVYEELKVRGFLFETQKLINSKFVVDAYIPNLNLVIEADGDYWHSLERVVKKDKVKNAYLTKCGFDLLRLTETEINSGEFKNKLPS